jgi:hypothetical protein
MQWSETKIFLLLAPNENDIANISRLEKCESVFLLFVSVWRLRTIQTIFTIRTLSETISDFVLCCEIKFAFK